MLRASDEGYFVPGPYSAVCKNSSKSAIAGWSICFSIPSGISDMPVLLSWSMSIRRTVSVALSARLSVMLVAVSAAMRPVSWRPSASEHGVIEILRVHLAVRIEHVQQNRFRAAGFHRGEAWADVIANALHLVAGGAGLGENLLAAGGVTFHFQDAAIGFRRRRTRRPSWLLTSSLLAARANRRIAMLGQQLQLDRIDIAGADLARFDRRSRPASTAAATAARRWLAP